MKVKRVQSLFSMLLLITFSLHLSQINGGGRSQSFFSFDEKSEENSVGPWRRSSRVGRYLFPFAIVNFPPEPCSPTNTQQMDGVCLSRKRCSASAGETVGNCQQGLGTCCKFTKQCFANRRAVTVVETVENLMSSSMAGSCEFMFPKQQGICQIRLDFTNVILQEAQYWGPNAGNCQSESLTVVGAANLNGPLKVCGRLTGQHMILSYGATSDLISVVLHSEQFSATYNIRATQIPCTSPYKAPDDCLQYFSSTTSAIKSFGFPRQLNNQRYTICVKPNSGGTSLSWDKCTDMDADGLERRDRFKVSEQPKPCLTDWVAIDAEKRCGQEFLPVTTTMGSHSRIRVNFDENEQGDDLFRVELSPTSSSLMNDCENDIRLEPQIFQAMKKLCTFTQPNICECKFSNMPDMSAQAFRLELNTNGQQNYICPKIRGYTAFPEKVQSSPCEYYGNLRVTDRNNTGFCLRYQAM